MIKGGTRNLRGLLFRRCPQCARSNVIKSPKPVALVEVERPGDPGPAYKAFTSIDRAMSYFDAELNAGRHARLIRLTSDRWEWVI